ncbi:MAG: urease accessory protein UreD [Gaiellales bacterium]
MGSPRRATGLLELTLAPDDASRTNVVARRLRFPLRMTVPLYLDPVDRGMAFVYIQNPTGGVFAGDDLTVDIDAQPGSRLHLTTQSATKVEGSAVQRIDIRAHAGSYVEYVPDALIPHAGSRYEQLLRVELGEGASFVGTELVAPGRIGRGERFAYTILGLDTVVTDGRSTLMAETMLLEPSRRSPRKRGLLGDSNYTGVMFAVTRREGVAERLASELDSALERDTRVRGAAGELPQAAGAMARVLADSAPAALRALDAAWEVARRTLIALPLPPRRK